MSERQLIELSRKMTLSLSLEEMKAVKKYFAGLKRSPSSAEMEIIAQTWSEHCKHKTMTGIIKYRHKAKTGKWKEEIIDNLLKETIFRATEELNEKNCLSVFEDNAGVIEWNEEYGIAAKVETHNHPSAIEPSGGAETGVGGVIRDILGCGKGAFPVLNIDVFCFASPDRNFRKLPDGILHPKRIFRGVVGGVRDYGNRMGIPTSVGAIVFSEDFLFNPLVFCGTVGIIPKKFIPKKVVSGDLIVLIGGKTGRDGIHGATFSSIGLEKETAAGCVQIGDAIEEKKFADVLLKARDRNLFNSVTDCGAGGLSSAVGELGKKIGARVFLEKVPLKQNDLEPWEIFLSESQERMVLSVPKEKFPELKNMFELEDVEAVSIGEFVATGKLEVFFKRTKIADLDMEFLHSGVPSSKRQAVYNIPNETDALITDKLHYRKILKALLSEPNSASKEGVIRQYDHEVGGGTFLKPLQGLENDGPGDASAYAPRLDSPEKTVVTGNGINIRYGLKNPYKMALSVIDEAFRQITAAGGNPAHTAILDNFCWGNPNKNEQLASLVMASQACYDAATAYKLHFIS